MAFLNKIHFGHVCFGGATTVALGLFALLMGDITGHGFYQLMATVISVMILSMAFSKFE